MLKHKWTFLIMAMMIATAGCGGGGGASDTGNPTDLTAGEGADSNATDGDAGNAEPDIGAAVDGDSTGTSEPVDGTPGSTVDAVAGETPTEVETGTETETDAASPATMQTSDLRVSETFDFSTSWEMDIDFTLPLTNTFLSLCTDYDTGDGSSVSVDFDSCIVRTPVSTGAYAASAVPMTNEITSLVAVLIDFANPANPMYVEFPIETGQTTLEWTQGMTL